MGPSFLSGKDGLHCSSHAFVINGTVFPFRKRRAPLLISRIRDEWDRLSPQAKMVHIAHLTHSRSMGPSFTSGKDGPIDKIHEISRVRTCAHVCARVRTCAHRMKSVKSMKFNVIETMKLHDQRGRLSVQEKTVSIAHLTHS